MNWMSYQQWFDWIIAHRRDEEDVEHAVCRLAWTFAYCDSHYHPLGLRPRHAMAVRMRLKGIHRTQVVHVCRRVQRYGLSKIELGDPQRAIGGKR